MEVNGSVVLDKNACEAHKTHSWLIVDELQNAATLLGQLIELQRRIRQGGWLWVRRYAACESVRAEQPRWKWLACLLEGQGFTLRNEGFTVQPGCTYMVFRRNAPSLRWHIRNPAPPDYPECRLLFEKAFGHSISDSLWDWKYGQGRGRAMVALRGEHVIAHYGCVSRRIVLKGRETKALQICDVMVAPSERAIMTRSGAFTQIARTAQEQFIGFETEHELGFGFPNQRHMQLAHRMGLYDEVERLDELEWKPKPIERQWFTESLILDPASLDRSMLERLWADMQTGLSDRILVVRDADYWFYRYIIRPEQTYVLLAIRRRLGGKILGVVALRRDENECKLLDVLGHPRYYQFLVRHARNQTEIWGLPMLRAWVTKGCAGFFITPDVGRKHTDIVIPLNAHARSRPVSEIQGRWFLMMGDTDFL